MISCAVLPLQVTTPVEMSNMFWVLYQLSPFCQTDERPLALTEDALTDLCAKSAFPQSCGGPCHKSVVLRRRCALLYGIADGEARDKSFLYM